MKKITLLFALFTFLMVSCDRNTIVDPPASAANILFSDLLALHDSSAIPGFAVSVVKNGNLVFQNSFGYADVQLSDSYKNSTTQPIASISKTFIGFAIAKLIEDGKFTLETNINDILPFEAINPHQPEIPIQVKHLVTHTSGLLDDFEIYIGSYFILQGESSNLTPTMEGIINEFNLTEGDFIALDQYLAAYYTEDGPFYDEDNFIEDGSGVVYEYSNIASSLAAFLVEYNAGIPYNEYIKNNVFQPLGMNDSGFFYDEVNQANASNLHFTKTDPYPKYGNHSYADGFLMSSNIDFGKYLLEMIKGADGNGRLLKDEFYDLLFKKSELPSYATDAGHGIFWEVTADRIQHDGSDPGVTTFLSFDPITKSGFTLMLNIDTDSDQGEIIRNEMNEIMSLVSTFEKL